MEPINDMLAELDERNLARKIGIPHDEARMSYSLGSNTCFSFREFEIIIGNYMNCHISSCVSFGGKLATHEATGRAKEILEKEYRKKGGTIVTAFNDAHDGTDGGMRKILDVLAEALKAESLERYIRDVFDRYVAPNSWGQKVEIMRQFFAQCGVDLGNTIHTDHPERYAQNYQDVIRTYTEVLKSTSSVLRSL